MPKKIAFAATAISLIALALIATFWISFFPEASTEPSTNPPIHIPFTLNNANNILVEVGINGEQKLLLMFHTSADSVTLTREAVAKLASFRDLEKTTVQSWGGEEETLVSHGNLLHLGPMLLASQDILVNEQSGPGSDGKFGPHLFGDRIIEINFDSKEIVLHDQLPKNVTSKDSPFRKAPLRSEQGSLFTDGSVLVDNQEYPLPLMIHSGFGGTLLLDDAFATKHQLTTKLTAVGERFLQDSFGNKIRVVQVELPQLTLAENTFQKMPIELFDGSIGNQRHSVIGCDILRQFNWILDIKQQMLFVQSRKP